MKYLIYILLAVGFGMLIFSLFQLNYDDPFSKGSAGALIGVLASACVIVIMLILMATRAIQKKAESNEQ